MALHAQISAAEYSAAHPDPVAAFSAPVCSHMNKDHMGDTLAMIKHYVGITVDSATLLDLDRLGMNVQVMWKGSVSCVEEICHAARSV